MNIQALSSGPSISRVWRNLVHEIVDIVPEEMACCEFDCRKTQCSYEEWATCERRLAYMSNSHTTCTPCDVDEPIGA